MQLGEMTEKQLIEALHDLEVLIYSYMGQPKPDINSAYVGLDKEALMRRYADAILFCNEKFSFDSEAVF